MATNYKFEGWVGEDKSSAEGKMVWKEYEPKKWEETDIDIQVTHSGVCGSDIHVLRSGWAPSNYPVVVGHEIVGTAVRVGSQAVGNIKVGDAVGVGPQNDACLERDGFCRQCHDHEENYCPRKADTFNGRHYNGDKTYGGHALYHRAPSHFVVKLPPNLRRELAAPMLCAGVSVYSPLKRLGAGPGKQVGIIGVGGLGHFAVMFAKALGADKVVGVSRRSDKREDALKLGCDEYIATAEEEGWGKKWANQLDIIINTVSSAKMPMAQYIRMLDSDGTLVQLGAPDEPVPISLLALTGRRRHLSGSFIGSPDEIREMFQLAADKGIVPWIEQRPMQDANRTIVDMEDGKARYRYVLVNSGEQDRKATEHKI